MLWVPCLQGTGRQGGILRISALQAARLQVLQGKGNLWVPSKLGTHRDAPYDSAPFSACNHTAATRGRSSSFSSPSTFRISVRW